MTWFLVQFDVIRFCKLFEDHKLHSPNGLVQFCCLFIGAYENQIALVLILYTNPGGFDHSIVETVNNNSTFVTMLTSFRFSFLVRLTRKQDFANHSQLKHYPVLFQPVVEDQKKFILRWIEKSTPPYQILWRIHSPVYQEEFQEIVDIFHRTKPVILSRGGPP